MAQTVPIQYRDFYDVPRVFVARYKGQLFLFDCPFDDTLDEYPDHYEVHLLPNLKPEDLQGSWKDISRQSVRRLGCVSASSLRFDPTRRQQIETNVFDMIVTASVVGVGTAR